MTSSKRPNTAQGTETENGEKWVQGVLQNHLDQEADNIDFVVSSKLKAARHRALAQDGVSTYGKPATNSRMPKPAFIASAAVFAVAMVLGLQWFNKGTLVAPQPTDQIALTQGAPVEDLNILTANDDIEFFQNIELLEWMDSNSG